MTITEIKKWAKSKGYSIIKDNGDEEAGDPVQYYWAKIDDPMVTGVAASVSKVATAIYNHITDNKWVDYQKEYQASKVIEKFNISNYG